MELASVLKGVGEVVGGGRRDWFDTEGSNYGL